MGANTGATGDIGGHFGEKVHIAEGCGAAAQHFGNGQRAAVAHKLFANPAVFGGPDMLVQPAVQRLVVGHATKQAHGGVAVSVDQAGHNGVVAKFELFFGPQRAGLVGGQYGVDQPVANGEGVVLEYRTALGHGQYPAGKEQGVGLGAISVVHAYPVVVVDGRGARPGTLAAQRRKYTCSRGRVLVWVVLRSLILRERKLSMRDGNMLILPLCFRSLSPLSGTVGAVVKSAAGQQVLAAGAYNKDACYSWLTTQKRYCRSILRTS